MTYTKTNWQSGDVISAEKLNKMENGIAESGGEVLIVNSTKDDNDHLVLDKTWQEIYDAMIGNKPVFVKTISDDSSDGYACYLNMVIDAIYDPSIDPTGSLTPYTIDVTNAMLGNIVYVASTANGYPSTEISFASDDNNEA